MSGEVSRMTYKSANSDSGSDGWDRACADITCDSAASGQEAKEECDLVERLRGTLLALRWPDEGGELRAGKSDCQ